jgi:hypothetical protein
MMGLGVEVKIGVSGLAVHFVTQRTIRSSVNIPVQDPPKRRFLQEPHGVTSQKAPFFIVTAVKTSNLA